MGPDSRQVQLGTTLLVALQLQPLMPGLNFTHILCKVNVSQAVATKRCPAPSLGSKVTINVWRSAAKFPS